MRTPYHSVRRDQQTPLRDCDAVPPSSRYPPRHTRCAHRARQSFCHGSGTSQRRYTPVQAARTLPYRFYYPHSQPIFTPLCLTFQVEQEALGPSTSEKAMLSAATPQVEPVVKRKKGPKGPNPLSVKKKAPPKHAVQETKKTRVAATPRVEEVEIANKRKRLEVDDGGGVSVEMTPRPKRRRRHKTATRPEMDG